MLSSDPGPRAAIFGCSGPALSAEERAFFRDADPLGFIVFARNVRDPDQLRRLTGELREAVDRAAPILVDQEGGRIQRLRPPHWRAAPPAGLFGRMAGHDPGRAMRAAWLNARLLATELAEAGIDVDCAPVLDLIHPGADPVIGDRAFGGDPELVGQLGRAVMEGLMAGGVLPVIKHIPGHGRATQDSHKACPVVTASGSALRADLVPFRMLADAPLAMTAHIVYTAWDAARPATLSPAVIRDVIRGEIGFTGALLSDDIGMGALDGSLADRARAALGAGCDLVLHCSGSLPEMRQVAEAVERLRGASGGRVQSALARRSSADAQDTAELVRELDALIAGARR